MGRGTHRYSESVIIFESASSKLFGRMQAEFCLIINCMYSVQLNVILELF